MRKLLLLVGVLGMGCLSAQEKAEDPMAGWFKQAREIAAEQSKDSIEMAEISEFAKELGPLEKMVAKEWERFLDYVEASDDEALKIRVLRLEFCFALTGSYYLMEEADGKLARLAARAKSVEYKKIIEQLDERLDALEKKKAE